MSWASGSAPLDDFPIESTSDEVPPVRGQGSPRGQELSGSSKRRIYAVLCLAASAAGKRSAGKLRALASYRARLGITPTDAETAEALAGHMKSVRVGRRQPEQDALMAALVELLTSDGAAPGSRERQLLERIGKRASWSPRRIEERIQACLRPSREREREDTGALFDASLQAPALRPRQDEEDLFGASLQAPALRPRQDEEDLFGASLQAPALPAPALPAPARDPFASDPFANDPLADDPLAGDPLVDDPFAEAAAAAAAPPPPPPPPPPRAERSAAPPLGLTSQHSLAGLDLQAALGSDLGSGGGFALAEDDEDSDTGIIRDPSFARPAARRRRGA